MFVLTEDKVRANEIQSCVAAGCSILACSTIVLLSVWINSVPSARNLLDRVSFRLLLHALCFEIIYDISYIVVVAPGINGRSADGVCATGVYFMMATMGVVNYHITFIAVNLAATIVFGLNSIRLNLESWYMYISLFMGFFIPIVPATLGHFGWDPVLEVCWIRAGDNTSRMRNLVVDLYLWQLISVLIAAISVIMTLVTLFRQGRATSRALNSCGDTLDLTFSGTFSGDDTVTEPVPTSRVGRFKHRRRMSRQKRHTFGHLEDKFVQIAIRITAYPVALAIVNGIIAFGDLYISATGGVKTRAEFGLYIVYYFFYGARGCVFAFICVFVDPCLRNGVREAWAVKFPKKDLSVDSLPSKECHMIPPTPPPTGPTNTIMPGEQGSDMDFMQALFELDDTLRKEMRHQATPNIKSAFWRTPTSPPPSRVSEKEPDYSQEFAGVPLSALPSGLNDGADDIVEPAILAQARAVDAMERMLGQPGSPSGENSPGLVERLKVVDKLQRRVDKSSRGSSRDPTRAQSRALSPDPEAPGRSNRRPSMAARSSGGRRSSGARTPRTADQERRERRDRAQELAERLYDELQAQL